jgi:hypothetical protein
MDSGNGLVKGASPDPFEPVRESHRFKISPAALERLSDLAKIPAHYRPTFANSVVELFAKSHRWHRIAGRSIQMDAATKELGRVANDARKLKNKIDKLSKQARGTFGLYALRLEQFDEADSHEAVRNQIEDILHSGSFDRAVQKVEYLSWTVGRIASAAATETWPKRPNSSMAASKRGKGTKAPYVDTFNRFVIELDQVVRACNSPLRFEPNDMTDGLTAFLEAASAHLPNGFIPEDVFYTGQNSKRTVGSRLKRLMPFWL